MLLWRLRGCGAENNCARSASVAVCSVPTEHVRELAQRANLPKVQNLREVQGPYELPGCSRPPSGRQSTPAGTSFRLVPQSDPIDVSPATIPRRPRKGSISSRSRNAVLSPLCTCSIPPRQSDPADGDSCQNQEPCRPCSCRAASMTPWRTSLHARAESYPVKSPRDVAPGAADSLNERPAFTDAPQ
jgi:hypothetical protein